jgi:hypothetical protein
MFKLNTRNYGFLSLFLSSFIVIKYYSYYSAYKVIIPD